MRIWRFFRNYDKFSSMASKNYSIKNKTRIRLDEFLRLELPKILNSPISNSKVRRLIVSGCVRVNNVQTRIPAFVLNVNSNVVVFVDDDKIFFEKQPDDIKFDLTEKEVLFEDDSIIVVNKPTFFPTEAGMVGSRDNLHAAVIRYLFEKQKKEHPNMKNPPYVGVMHRLDRETSGVILFTKSRSVNAHCHDMFENHTAQKIYRAVVSVQKTSKVDLKIGSNFTVDFFMNRVSLKSQAAKWGKVSSKDGVPSKTEFTIVGEKKGKFFVECKPLTGRTHQIRVHLSSLNLAIVGDELYGGENNGRIMLHAQSLLFPHPVTKEIVKIEAPLPEGFSC